MSSRVHHPCYKKICSVTESAIAAVCKVHEFNAMQKDNGQIRSEGELPLEDNSESRSTQSYALMCMLPSRSLLNTVIPGWLCREPLHVTGRRNRARHSIKHLAAKHEQPLQPNSIVQTRLLFRRPHRSHVPALLGADANARNGATVPLRRLY
nr:hypothetical protein Iba_chr10aCG4660 [Ipomoea batatas]